MCGYLLTLLSSFSLSLSPYVGSADALAARRGRREGCDGGVNLDGFSRVSGLRAAGLTGLVA